MYYYLCFVILLMMLLFLPKLPEGFGPSMIVVLLYATEGCLFRTKRYDLGLADEPIMSNPLYVKGHFRKKAKKDPFIVSNLKGLYYGQIVTFVSTIITLLYIVYGFYLKIERYIWLEQILYMLFAMLFVAWVIMNIYYQRIYFSAFRYTESEDGIWKPFQFMTTRTGSFFSRHKHFSCYYHMEFEELIEQLMESTKCRNFKYFEQYNVENGEKAWFFARKKGNIFDIFEVIHIEEYFEEYVELFNKIFEVFWEQNVKEKYECKNINLTVLLCVDRDSRKLMGCRDYINQKKGRNRLLAVMINEGKHPFEILKNATIMPRGRYYHKMRAELLNMMGLTELDNGKHCWQMKNDEN